VVDGDVLVPLPDLARQLSLTVKSEGPTMTISSPTVAVALDLATGLASVTTPTGPETRPLQPATLTIDGVLLVPLRTLATWFGLQAQWQPAERILRVSRPGQAAVAAPTEPAPPPEPGAPGQPAPPPRRDTARRPSRGARADNTPRASRGAQPGNRPPPEPETRPCRADTRRRRAGQPPA